MGVSRVFHECFKGVTRVFPRCFEGLRKFQMILNMFQDGFVRISPKFPGSFMDVSGGFQEYF